MSVRVEFRWPESLLERVDAARGDGQPRADWIRRTVERALDGYPVTGGPTQETFDAVVGERDRLEDELRERRAAPAEQPEKDLPMMAELRAAGMLSKGVSPPKPIPPRVPSHPPCLIRRDVKPFPRGDK